MRYAPPASLALAVAFGCAGAAAADTSAGPALDGPAIFARARDAWTAMTYPPLLSYDVVVRAVRSNRAAGDRYGGVLRPASGDFRVALFGAGEQQHSYVPHGTNVRWGVGIGYNSGGRGIGETGDHAVLPSLGGAIAAETPVEPFAVPEISPLYSFGIRACAAARTSSDDAPGGLRRIGSVATLTRRYRITLAGTDALDEGPALHLVLEPVADAKRDRLRDLWIAPDSYRVLRARVAGNFSGGGTSDVPWLIRFASLDGATYVASETSEAPVRRGRAVYDRVEIRFENVRAERGPLAGLAFARPRTVRGVNAIEEPPEAFAAGGC